MRAASYLSRRPFKVARIRVRAGAGVVVVVELVPRPFKVTQTLTLSVSLTRTLALTLLHQVVCVDCDNTLWRGVVGEVDDLGLLLPNLPLQRALKACAQRGLVLATCSKNIAADVEAAFSAHPEWPLAYSDFVVHKEYPLTPTPTPIPTPTPTPTPTQENWEPKSANVLAIAEELDLSELATLPLPL